MSRTANFVLTGLILIGLNAISYLLIQPAVDDEQLRRFVSGTTIVLDILIALYSVEWYRVRRDPRL